MQIRDPVCGMSVPVDGAIDKSEFDGRTCYFCSAQCRREFDRDPARFLGRTELRHELGELIMAMRSVLRRAGIPWRRVLASTEPIVRGIADVLLWPGSLDVSAKVWDV